MKKQEILDKIEEIKQAIIEKNYEVDCEAPNNCDVYTAPDGTEFLLLTDLDGPTSSNDYGDCSIKIAGISYSKSLDPDYFGYECEYLNMLNDEDEFEDSEDEYPCEYIDEIIDLIESVPEFTLPSDGSIDDQAETYFKIMGCDPLPYYYYDETHPISIDDFVPIEEAGNETLVYDGVVYYYDEFNVDDDGIIAVSEHEKPNMFGQYKTVRLIKEDGEIVDIEDNDEWYNSTENTLEEECVD